jgi:hypothetical protein
MVDKETEVKPLISEVLGIEICYEVHASNRSFEREIDILDVKRVIDDPDTQCQIQKNGRLKFTNSGTVVIGEVRKSCLWIKTVYRVRRKERP